MQISEQVSQFVGLALQGIQREYPNKLDHVINGEGDLQSPRALHPAFYGCFDWHSAVHAHWMLVRLLKLLPDLPEAPQVRAALSSNLAAENIAVENAYLARPNARSFERTYGWAWLLKLAEELHGWDDPDGQRWSRDLQPLADTFVARYLDFLPRQTYPIRTGTHANTAFGLTFALDYAREVGHSALESLLVERSMAYFGGDENYGPAAWEPAGNDFLSPSLVEADLMRRVLPPGDFGEWFRRFLPGISNGEPANLLQPATVSDRTDGQIVHLDGLNLSRAWCMRGVSAALDEDDPARALLYDASEKHLQAALPHIASGDYAGEHWLSTFAVYALGS